MVSGAGLSEFQALESRVAPSEANFWSEWTAHFPCRSPELLD